MLPDTKELLEKRATLVTQAREILDKHREAGTMPADVQAGYDKAMADVGDLTLQIEQRNSFATRQNDLEKAAAWDKELRSKNVPPETPEQRAATNPTRPPEPACEELRFHGRVEKRTKNSEALGAFERYLHGQASGAEYHGILQKGLTREYRSMLADTAGSGHDLIPPVEFIDQILIPRDRQVLVRKKATVRRLLKSTDGYQPTIETNPDDADWTSEVANVNEDSGLTTGKRELKPNVLTKLVKVSIKELMVLPQVSELIADRLGYKFGVTEEKGFLTGNGTGQPMGLFTAAGAGFGITTAQDVSAHNTSAAVTFDGLQGAKFALPPPYWPNAEWIFHPTIMGMIATLKDLLDRYLWQPNTQVGQPDMLLGFPARLDVWAPSTVAANAYVGILGDMSYYHIADLVEQFTVQRLNELYAGNNQVGFLGREYTDGMPVMAEAFIRVKLGASTGS